MKKLVSIDLSSELGFFKNPQFNGEIDNNSYSFDSIHKLAIYGLLGRLIGLRGVNNPTDTTSIFPEYYDKLKDIKIGISVLDTIKKDWICTTSSSGLYSNDAKKVGQTLIMNKNVIVNPNYRLYLQLELENEDHNSIYKSLKDNLEPYFGYLYFGKSSFMVERNNFQEYNFKKVDTFTGIIKTLFRSEYDIPRSRRENNIDNVYDIGFIFDKSKEVIYQRKVSLPIDYIQRKNKSISYGKFVEFIMTNKKVKIDNVNNDEEILELDGTNEAICMQ